MNVTIVVHWFMVVSHFMVNQHKVGNILLYPHCLLSVYSSHIFFSEFGFPHVHPMFAQELSDKNQAPKHTATCCDEIGV